MKKSTLKALKGLVLDMEVLKSKRSFIEALGFDSLLAQRAIRAEIEIRELKRDFNLFSYLIRVKGNKTPYTTLRGFRIWIKKQIEKLEKLIAHEAKQRRLDNKPSLRRAEDREIEEEIRRIKG